MSSLCDRWIRQCILTRLTDADDQLKDFVAMEPAGERYRLAKGNEVIYMRSFSMTANVLLNILQEMQKIMEMQRHMESNASMHAWHSRIQALQSGDSVTLRYIGRVRVIFLPRYTLIGR